MKKLSTNDQCVICLGEDNLKYAKICCGSTFFHDSCLNDYCNVNNQPKCVICSKSIADKFNTSTHIYSYSVTEWNYICLYSGLILSIIFATSITSIICLQKNVHMFMIVASFIFMYILYPLYGHMLNNILKILIDILFCALGYTGSLVLSSMVYTLSDILSPKYILFVLMSIKKFEFTASIIIISLYLLVEFCRTIVLIYDSANYKPLLSIKTHSIINIKYEIDDKFLLVQ